MTIVVTDAQTVSDLDDYVSNIKIEGAIEDEDGYIVAKDDSYEIVIRFTEHNDLQFATHDNLTYHLPKGFMPEAATKTGKIESKDGIMTFTYTIDEDGKVTMYWPDNVDPEVWHDIVSSQYMELAIEVKGTFDGTVKQVKFSDTASGTVNVNTENGINVNKTGSYNPQTNQIDYTVTVMSTGHNENVIVTDVISGTALTYTQKSASTQKSGAIINENDNGFVCEIPSMINGETVTIKYSADVDLTKISKGENGVIGTIEETGNKVTATGKDVPEDSDEIDARDFSTKISYTTLSKIANGDVQDTADENKKLQSWKIVANENANYSMAGKTITDTITTPDTLSYTGEGITITVYDKSGVIVRPATVVNWGSDGLVKDGSSWTYTVPTEDENKCYSYEITYDTEVTLSSTNSTKISNKANDEFGHEPSGGKDFNPTGGKTDLKKEYTKVDIDNQEVTWKITVEVPKIGFNTKCEVWETYPNLYLGWDGTENKYAYDTLVGDIEFLNLLDGETYDLNTDSTGKLGIIFYQDEAKTQPGLQGNGGQRLVTITLTTRVSDEVMERVNSQTGTYWHANNVRLDTGDNTIDKSASAPLSLEKVPPLSKYHENWTTTNTIEGATEENGGLTQLKAYPYRIQLNGITDDSFDINGNLILTDTYDARYFTWVPIATDANQEQKNGYLYATKDKNQPFNVSGVESGKVMTQSQEGVLTITLKKSDILREDGSYYPVYTIPYYLTVKSAEAQLALDEAASSSYAGKYKIKNTVTGGDGEVIDELEYTTDIINKTAAEAKKNDLNGYYEVDYTLVANPNAKKLGSGKSLELIDTSTNLSVDIATIKATPSLGVTWEMDGDNRLVFTIPNATPVTITYTAKIIGTGNVNYINTAELYGQSTSVNKWQTITTDASGKVRNYSVDIYKYVTGDDYTEVLEGVKFDLYTLDDGYAEHGVYDKYNKPPTDLSAKLTEDKLLWREMNDQDKPFVTDSEGRIIVDAYTLTEHDPGHSDSQDGHLSLYVDHWYMLVEEGPVVIDGVEYDTAEPYLFMINSEEADYENHIYLNDDVIRINNTPSNTETLEFTIKKIWEGVDSSDIPEKITVRLMQKKSIYDDKSTAVEYAVMEMDASNALSDNALVWTGKFENLPKNFVYYIEEDPIPGFIPIYEDKNTIGYKRSGTIEFSNEKRDLTIKKEWIDEYGNVIEEPEYDWLVGIPIDLYKDGELYGSYVLERKNGWEITLTDLEFPAVYTVEEGHVGGYTLSNILYCLYYNSWQDYKEVQDLYDTRVIVIRNQRVTASLDSTVSLEVDKTWRDVDGNKITDLTVLDGLAAKVCLVRYRTEVGKDPNTTIIHFVYKDTTDSSKPKYTEIYNDIAIERTESITLQIEYEKDISWQIGYMTDGFAANTEKWVQGAWVTNDSPTAKYTITEIGNTSEIYIICQNKIKTDMLQVQNATIKTIQPVEYDSTFDSTNYTVVLDKYNTWRMIFNNLPHREVVDGVTYIYSYGVKEISTTDGYHLCSYRVDYGDYEAPNEYGSSSAGNYIEIINCKDFTFYKIWQDANGGNIEWQEDIEVSLHRTFTPDDGTDQSYDTIVYALKKVISDDGSVEFTMKPVSEGRGTTATLTLVSSEKYPYYYKATISGLPVRGKLGELTGKWSYYVQEEPLDGYQTSYYRFDSNGDLIAGTDGTKESAEDGEVIVNKPSKSYHLPETGGLGTTKYLFGGILLMSIALFFSLKTKLKLERRG